MLESCSTHTLILHSFTTPGLSLLLKMLFLSLSSYCAKEIFSVFKTRPQTQLPSLTPPGWTDCFVHPLNPTGCLLLYPEHWTALPLPLGLHINPPSPTSHSLYCELLEGGDYIWIYLWIFIHSLAYCSIQFCWMNKSVILSIEYIHLCSLHTIIS